MIYKKQKRLTYGETIRFHGHDGPFLALGYKLGLFIINRLKPKGIIDMTINVRVRLKKPYTCFIDGLQCSTFATVGKGNLRVTGRNIDILSVIAVCNDKKLKVVISQKAMKICKDSGDLKKAARSIFKTPDNILFNIKNP